MTDSCAALATQQGGGEITHLVRFGGVGACLPALFACTLLNWTTVERLERIAEAGAGPWDDPGRGTRVSGTPRGEGSESSLGWRTFLLGSMGVWLEPLDGGRSSASTSSVMDDSCVQLLLIQFQICPGMSGGPVIFVRGCRVVL